MQSVLIYFTSEAYPLQAYKDEELGFCLVPTNKLNQNSGYHQPKYATAFIHYDKVIDIERTKDLFKDLVIFMNFLHSNWWLNSWYLTGSLYISRAPISNISSVDNLINNLNVPFTKDYFTVDYCKYKLFELIPKPPTVDFFPLFNKFVNLSTSKKESLLRRLIELYSFNTTNLQSNRLYKNEYFSISVSFIILEVLVKDEIKNSKKIDLCPNCGYEKESDRHIKDLISEYIHNSKIIHPNELESIERMLHKFADVRNFFFHSGRKVNQEKMFEQIKKLKGSVSFDVDDDIDIADGTVMGIWTLHSFVRRILIGKLESI